MNKEPREWTTNFVYRPQNVGNSNIPEAKNATLGVKFAQGVRFLDPNYLIGGTPWTRFLYRLKHPIIYGKRRLRNVWRKIKRFFVGDPPMKLATTWMTKEEMLKLKFEREKYGNNQKQTNTSQQNQGTPGKRGG